MRLLDTDELLELLPATPDQIHAAADKLITFAPSGTRPETLVRAVQEGFCQAHSVAENGKPVFMLLWHPTFDNCLVIDGAVSLCGGHDHFLMISRVAEHLARQNNCRHITFKTQRKGLAHRAMSHGYKATDVTLSKTVPL